VERNAPSRVPSFMPDVNITVALDIRKRYLLSTRSARRVTLLPFGDSQDLALGIGAISRPIIGERVSQKGAERAHIRGDFTS
jgi:hypothetical protein